MKMSLTAKRMMIGIIIISLVGLGVGLFFISDPIPYTIGIIFGSIVSLIKVYLLEKSIDKMLDLPPKEAENRMKLSHVARYLFTGVVLAGTAIFNSSALFGATVGILSMPLSAYIITLFFKEPAIQENTSASLVVSEIAPAEPKSLPASEDGVAPETMAADTKQTNS